jgi:hypothetical protein
MTDSDLSQQQRTTIKILDDYILDSNILEEKCPLDYSRHDFDPQFDLGTLQELPIELQHHVLGFLDMKTLLTFRVVSMSAMRSVDGMIEYQKVTNSRTALRKSANG